MIVRILGDGQYELPENMESEFERLDNHLVAHVEDGDEEAFRKELADLVGIVRVVQVAHSSLPCRVQIPDLPAR